MGESSRIGWTDHTFNPWWGCERVSPGCQNCYAEAFAKRTGNDVWGRTADRRFLSDNTWAQPVRWNRKAEAEGVRRRVFCASMADVFEDRPELAEHRERLWALVEATPWLDWLLLTKRPQNILRMVRPGWATRYSMPLEMGGGITSNWPRNVWVGTTVEDQQRADERIPWLFDVPAPVRFLSCEPLLGPVDLHPGGDPTAWLPEPEAEWCCIDWVIIGGESGPGHRPMDLDWARRLVAQVSAAGRPVFFKQVSGPRPGTEGPADLERFKQFPKGEG